MNPAGDNRWFEETIDAREVGEGFLKGFTIVCTCFWEFGVVAEWDRLTKKANKPYYNIFSAGPYASCFVSLGSSYTYKDPPKPLQHLHTIPSLTL